MLAGSLTEFTLPDVFTLLATTRKSGVLNLTASPEDGTAPAGGRVWVLGGELAYAVADTTRSPLAARLLHSGEIEPADVEPLIHAQASGHGVQMAAALAGLGISEDRARTLLHDQVVDAAFDLARWPAGQFAFDAGLDGGGPGTPTFGVTDVMAAVDARLVEWEGIVATLPSPASVLRPVPRPPVNGGSVSVGPEQWEVLTLIDGVRTVAEIIQLTGKGQYTVARLLASLVGDGLVQIREDVSPLTVTQIRAAHLARVEHEVLGAPAPADQALVVASHQPMSELHAVQEASADAGTDWPRPADPADAPQTVEIHLTDTPPAQAQPAEAQPVDAQPAEAEPVAQTAEAQPVDTQPVDTQPVDTRFGEDPQPTEGSQDDQSAQDQPTAGDAAQDQADGFDLDSLLNGSPSSRTESVDDVSVTHDDTDDDERIRELAALGLGEADAAPAEEAETDDGDGRRPLDEGLLARLIDGVKGV